LVAVILLLLVSAVPIVWHVPSFGPIGLGLFLIALLLASAVRRPPRPGGLTPVARAARSARSRKIVER
jgi:hypothetical protein